ncbi:hypothetical protein CSA08_01450 [Candidatus Gracilibacteria bacterium]|nr:MAG: hypothetical protein CSA08_01450 [Candidatus Gracilibacteria bacterium]
MEKTKTKRVLATIALAGITVANIYSPSPVSADIQIGTGSVVGSGSFDSPINWDENFPGTASGSVSNIKIKARVLPTLNMSISAPEIDLGVLAPGVASNGSLYLEVGTNAKSGVSITARSNKGGMENNSSAGVMINQDATDGVSGESYTYESTPNVTDDSSAGDFSASGLANVEVNNNTTEHAIYTTNRGEATNLVDDVEFKVSATAVAETPAGDYEDTVTFTIVGNF